MTRVAVTGMGVISPLGNSTADVIANACAGRSAVHRLESSFAHRLSGPLVASAQFDGTQHFAPPRLRMLDRVSQLACVAARQSLEQSRVDLTQTDRRRIGVFMGTGMGGSQSSDEAYRSLYEDGSDRVLPFTVLMGMHNAPAAWIGIEHDLRGPNVTYSTACSSSAVAIGEASLRIARGDLDLAVAGGAEAPLSFGSLRAWEALHTLASVDAADPSTSCKPFAQDRSGMVLAEGSAMLVLEDWEHALARGVRILGEIAGYGFTNDTGHITRPSVDGQGAAIEAALTAAGIERADVDAINAHGTGTQANDGVETGAIKAVFGTRAASIPVSATKAMHGHLLGAAGALECVLSLLAMQREVALPTMHLRRPDPACDLDYVPNRVREGVTARTMISSSFAFGGANAVLVLRAAP